MNLQKSLALALTATVVTISIPAALASQQDAIKSVESARQVLTNEIAEPQHQIPKSVRQNAVAIAIIPDVVKAGFILGGTRGAGVLVVNNNKGGWSNPAFVTLTGGSVGLQVGAQSSDIIIVFNTKKSLEKALAQDFQLGGSVTGTAGPTGASPVTGTSTLSDVYTYVRNREGLFGGVSLEGTKLEMDNSRNAEFYGKPNITAQQIFAGSFRGPEAAANLRQTLNGYAPR
ncbi:lipid-binding SYLF domain-containing protein [Chroococcus sp. FPU101]|uniref:lipid-binding SYLF domain-containing protein n=1 Tax=Chroococcus sp. FPU101 TaxID=1974212 RepID=UPI001A8E3562|nr:lipid-binding SYLF domain-containing protein [Chroococcus sp. FPU101]GFE71983.1 protein of unknown function DUF500 [Chroococcus sp. FPU101]